MTEHGQRQVCEEHGAAYDPPAGTARVGIALQTLHLKPLHGMRIAPHGGVCGWYLWGGELSQESDFFAALHVSHLGERCPQVVKFLGLPPGWRFLVAGDYEDVWEDPALLAPPSPSAE